MRQSARLAFPILSLNLSLKRYYILFIPLLCVSVFGHVFATAHMWRSDNLQELVPAFHPVGPSD